MTVTNFHCYIQLYLIIYLSMGNDQTSETMPTTPFISKLISNLNLNATSKPINQGQTYSLAHRHFSNEFARIEKKKFDRSMNPFCPISIQQSKAWMTCCLISPLMAIVCSSQLTKNIGKQCIALPVYNRTEIKAQIKQFLKINQMFSIAVLDTPFWRAGWAGISYVTDQEQLSKLDMKIVYHYQRAQKGQDQNYFHIQQVSRFRGPKTNQLQHDFTLEVSGVQGGLICKLIEKKPYIIGAQISSSHAMFFSKETFKQIQEICRNYIKKQGGEREILKAMDLQEFQIQIQL